MFKNYLRLAIRNFKKNGLYSLLNLSGLSIGLAVTILLFLYILHETSFDNMYPKKDRIERVLVHVDWDGMQQVWCAAPAAVGPALEQEVTGVQKAARLFKHSFGEMAFVNVGDKSFTENGLYWCDPQLIDIFDIPVINGDATTALTRPHTVMLSASTAQKYFGTQNPVGQTLVIDKYDTLEVTAVYRDFPGTSTLDCDMMGSFSSTNFYKQATWSNSSFETYCLLDEHTRPGEVEKRLTALLNKNVAKEDRWYSLSLQPLSKVHLYSADYRDTYSSRSGDAREVRNLSLLALLILVIACINYMNLATARSQHRAKEVGINKTLGASLRNLVIRFYAETGVITLLALLLGLILAVLAIPAFTRITGRSMELSLLLDIRVAAALLLVWVATTFVAGSYPALYLSRFSPLEVFRKKIQTDVFSALLRKGLVVIQFAASIVLIIGVLVMYRQLQYIREQKLGYNPENVLAINTRGASSRDQINNLINNLNTQSNVVSVSLAQGFPGMGVSGRTIKKNDMDTKGLSISTNRSTHNIVDVLQLKLLAGQSLPAVKNEKDSTVDVVLNKTAVDYLGYTPEEAIGKKVTAQLGDNAYIRGVVADFNYASLHDPIGAYAFHNQASEGRHYLLVRFRSGNLSASMDRFRKAYQAALPNAAFEYTFLDKHLETLYARDQRTAGIITTFSILAIFVACLGLFGLAAFTAEQRTKEIGIRKVLGARVAGIAALLSKDFLKLVLIALAISIPVAWYFMTQWLQGFAYRITPGWWLFALAGLLAIALALVTVSFQAIKAALMNPVKSLKTE